MNILEKQTNPNFHSNASYVLSSEHIIKAHLQQAFTGSNIFKNYLVASVMAREISRLKSIGKIHFIFDSILQTLLYLNELRPFNFSTSNRRLYGPKVDTVSGTY